MALILLAYALGHILYAHPASAAADPTPDEEYEDALEDWQNAEPPDSDGDGTPDDPAAHQAWEDSRPQQSHDGGVLEDEDGDGDIDYDDQVEDWEDNMPGQDTDGDGINDSIDADGDGNISEQEEDAYLDWLDSRPQDTDGDGIADSNDDDIDGDGVENDADDDDDGNGLNDDDEAAAGDDTNLDGTVDAGEGATALQMDNACVLYCYVTEICCSNPQVILNYLMVNSLQVWILQYYETKMEPDLQNMSDAWTDNLALQGRILGGFFDAQAHSAAMLSLQKLRAQAVNDYTPSEQICRFGSMSKSLGASEAIARMTKLGLAQRSQNRQTLNVNSNAALEEGTGRESGRSADKQGRLQQFIDTFCDTSDNDGSLGGAQAVCAAGIVDEQYNRDIDFARSFAIPDTLQLNFAAPAGTAVTADQRNLLALNANLYAHNIMLNRPNPDALGTESNDEASRAWLDFRTAIAKMSVAENTGDSIAAMKAAGSGASAGNMRALFREMGLTDGDIDRLFHNTNPSYYAQMEMLTKRMYQNPVFYAELMDKPTNVMRQQVAMKGIGLMQDNDIAESARRTEMLLSTLLELYVSEHQNKLLDASTQ